MRPKLTWLPLFLFVVAGTTLLSCSKKDGRAKDTLVVNILTEPPTLDWNMIADVQSGWVADNIMSGLLSYDLSQPNAKLIPSLATSWTLSKDELTYTFHLRKDAKWHDGVPFTSQHMVDSWKRLLDPKTAAPYAYFLYYVKNGKKFALNEADFSQVGIRAVDAHTLQVTLEQPSAVFLHIMTHAPTFPIRKDIMEKHGDRWTEAGNLVAIGPFKMTSWIHDSKLVLERNDDFFGEKAKLKTVEMRMVTEQSSALKLYETGQLDFLLEIPPLDMDRVRKLYPKELIQAPFFTTYFVGFNTRRKPFGDPEVRKAFSMAIDRTEITRILNGGQIPTSSWIPEGIPGYDPKRGLKFDPEKARQLLKSAGYDNPSKIPLIKLFFNTHETHQRVMENLQAQLAKNLGVKVELENLDWKVYNATLLNLKSVKDQENSSNLHLYRFGWTADYPDPDTFMSMYYTDSDNNHSGWGNKTYDQLVKKASAMQNMDARLKLYDQAQEILCEKDVPVMPLYVYTQHLMMKPFVKGYNVNGMQKLFLNTVYTE